MMSGKTSSHLTPVQFQVENIFESTCELAAGVTKLITIMANRTRHTRIDLFMAGTDYIMTF